MQPFSAASIQNMAATFRDRSDESKAWSIVVTLTFLMLLARSLPRARSNGRVSAGANVLTLLLVTVLAVWVAVARCGVPVCKETRALGPHHTGDEFETVNGRLVRVEDPPLFSELPYEGEVTAEADGSFTIDGKNFKAHSADQDITEGTHSFKVKAINDKTGTGTVFSLSHGDKVELTVTQEGKSLEFENWSEPFQAHGDTGVGSYVSVAFVRPSGHTKDNPKGHHLVLRAPPSLAVVPEEASTVKVKHDPDEDSTVELGGERYAVDWINRMPGAGVHDVVKVGSGVVELNGGSKFRNPVRSRRTSWEGVTVHRFKTSSVGETVHVEANGGKAVTVSLDGGKAFEATSPTDVSERVGNATVVSADAEAVRLLPDGEDASNIITLDNPTVPNDTFHVASGGIIRFVNSAKGVLELRDGTLVTCAPFVASLCPDGARLTLRFWDRERGCLTRVTEDKASGRKSTQWFCFQNAADPRRKDCAAAHRFDSTGHYDAGTACWSSLAFLMLAAVVALAAYMCIMFVVINVQDSASIPVLYDQRLTDLHLRDVSERARFQNIGVREQIAALRVVTPAPRA